MMVNSGRPYGLNKCTLGLIVVKSGFQIKITLQIFLHKYQDLR